MREIHAGIKAHPESAIKRGGIKMMKKWGMILSLSGALVISTEVMSQSGGGGAVLNPNCCYMSKISTSEDCCKGGWGNEENFEWRGGTCCSINNVTAAYALSPEGIPIRGGVVTEDCCTSQIAKGKDPGNYVFWPLEGAADTQNMPGNGGICCIADSWKYWSTGSNNARCCRAQGGEEHSDRCCFQAYDFDKKAHSKECCKAAEGKWENGDCCATEKDGTAMANQMYQSMTLDGKVVITYSGAKVTSNCCVGDGGNAYNKAFDSGVADLGCCIGGTVYGRAYNDSSETDVIEDCCKSPKVVSDLGDIDACCASDEDGYVKKVTLDDGSELKSGACCKGNVYIKKFVNPQNGNYGDTDCCETGKFAIGGACCQNSDDKEYPDGDYYGCCPSSNYADGGNGGEGECCEDPTSPRNIKGKPTQACCEHAYGEWVTSSSSAPGDPDQEESSASCCRGSMDIMTGSRTAACCENAGGKWMYNSFCCITWGKKINGACVADGLPEEGDKGYAGPLGGR